MIPPTMARLLLAALLLACVATAVRAFGAHAAVRPGPNPNPNHPVVRAIVERWRQGNSLPQARAVGDNAKIALSIEGGGMRGSIAAGMSTALGFLGLNDCIDVVYGSSAGAMVGAYFISRQFSGVTIYHDWLCVAGARFIDKVKLATVIVVSMLKLVDLSTKLKVFNLDFLLDLVMGRLFALDWDTYAVNEARQPLYILSSSLGSFKTVSLSRARGSYASLEGLLMCIKPFHVTNREIRRGADSECDKLVDALMFEPLPLETPAADGATHVLVLRTRKDPSLPTKPGLFERHVLRNFFSLIRDKRSRQWFLNMEHLRIYGDSVDLLNRVSASGEPAVGATYAFAIVPTEDEMSQFENRRQSIFAGMRHGALLVLRVFGTPLGIPEEAFGDLVDCMFPPSALEVDVDFERYGGDRIRQRGLYIETA